MGSIPTAPTKLMRIKGLTVALVVKKSQSRQLSDVQRVGSGNRIHAAESTPSHELKLPFPVSAGAFVIYGDSSMDPTFDPKRPEVAERTPMSVLSGCSCFGSC